jgi:hypothetical protein
MFATYFVMFNMMNGLPRAFAALIYRDSHSNSPCGHPKAWHAGGGTQWTRSPPKAAPHIR